MLVLHCRRHVSHEVISNRPGGECFAALVSSRGSATSEEFSIATIMIFNVDSIFPHQFLNHTADGEHPPRFL